MSGHLLVHCHMDVASPRCRLRLQAQVPVIPAKFTTSHCQTCTPVPPGLLLVTGAVNLFWAYVSLVSETRNISNQHREHMYTHKIHVLSSVLFRV